MCTRDFNQRRRTLLTAFGSVSIVGLSGCFSGGESGQISLAPIPDTDLQPPDELSPEEPPLIDQPTLPETDETLFPTEGTHPPRGIHASFIEDPYTSRTLTWFTDGNDAPQSFLRYTQDDAIVSKWASSQALPNNIEVSEVSDTFGVNAKTHRVTLRHLEPDKPIFYQVGSDVGGWSKCIFRPIVTTYSV